MYITFYSATTLTKI